MKLPGGVEVGRGHIVAHRGDDLPEIRVLHGLGTHLGDVPGGGVVGVVMVAVGVDEVGVCHAQSRRPLVHQLHKGGDAPGHGGG